jgi:hypothetical protein
MANSFNEQGPSLCFQDDSFHIATRACVVQVLSLVTSHGTGRKLQKFMLVSKRDSLVRKV